MMSYFLLSLIGCEIVYWFGYVPYAIKNRSNPELNTLTDTLTRVYGDTK